MKFNKNEILKILKTKSKYTSFTKLQDIDSIDLLNILIKLEHLLKKKISLKLINNSKKVSLSKFIDKINKKNL